MTDRELLEMAAKAARMADAKYAYNSREYGECMWSQALFDECGSGYWNPLTNDGDAFRLAVQLEMKVDFGHSDEICRAKCKAPRIHVEHIEPIVDEQYTAARRAITCAAAEIGRQMK